MTNDLDARIDRLARDIEAAIDSTRATLNGFPEFTPRVAHDERNLDRTIKRFER